MRKTRLVLIPGVKSLDTIGCCLLLFLACPTIAFKGQENREVDPICKERNLKEFWVDSPWPGDTDQLGWVRGFGGGSRPGDSRAKNTCNDLSTRSIVRSRSDDRRVQERREVSRDNGMGSRNMRLDNDMRRDARREMNNRRTDGLRDIRDSRRVDDGLVLNERRRMNARRLENRAARAFSRNSERETRVEMEVRHSTSDRDAMIRSAGQRTVTTREVINERKNSRSSSRDVDRRLNRREAREPEYRRTFHKLERANEAIQVEKTVRNREAIDGKRTSQQQIRSHSFESRRLSNSMEADTRSLGERVRSDERRTLDRRENERSAAAIRSLERGIRAESDVRNLARRESQSRERANQRMPTQDMRVDERRVMQNRRVLVSRRDSARTTSLERDARMLGANQEISHTREIDESRSAETRTLDDKRENINQNRHREIRSAERRTISKREIIDGRRLSSRSLDREMRNSRASENNRMTLNRRKSASLREETLSENRRALLDRLDSRRLAKYDRQVRSRRDAPESELQDRKSTRVDNARSAEERRFDDRRERENVRETSVRSIERRVLDVDRARRNGRNSERASRESTRATRLEETRLARQMERESRLTRSLENIRSEEREVGNRRHSEDRRDSRRVSLERGTGRREGREVPEFRTSDDFRRAERRNFKRTHDERAARGIQDVERARLAPSRLRLSARSLNDIRQNDFEVQRENRVEIEREISPEARKIEQSRRSESLSRSSEAFKQFDQRRRLSERETTRTIRRSEEEKTRRVERATPERNSRRLADVANRRDDTRIHLSRAQRAEKDARRSDQMTQRARREMRNVETTVGALPERSCVQRNTERAVDARRKVFEDSSRIIDRMERIGRRSASAETASRDGPRSQREIRSADERRESRRENTQRLDSADRRRIDKRDVREEEIRRISRDVSRKSESTRDFPTDARRSDRQRRVADVERDASRMADKRFTSESIGRFADTTEITNKRRHLLAVRKYAGQTNDLEGKNTQHRMNKEEKTFFESSKNQD